MRASFLLILVSVISLASVVIAVAVVYSDPPPTPPDIALLSRSDGEFVPFLPPSSPSPHALGAFYTTHNLKPIYPRFIITAPYTITVCIATNIHKLTVPANYVTDGVSTPIRVLPVPNEREDAYWVYHDYMYQCQRFDDGTPITKRHADDIMHRIILYNNQAPPWCKIYRLFVAHTNNDTHYWDSLYRRGPCFYVRQGVLSFPRCKADLIY